jgi:hypothetical protein
MEFRWLIVVAVGVILCGTFCLAASLEGRGAGLGDDEMAAI